MRTQTTDAYEIVLERPAKVGDRVRVEVRVTENAKQRETPSGKTEEGHLKYELHGLIEVLAVDPKGRPTNRKVLVQKLTIESNGQTGTVLPEGAVVHVTLPKSEEENPYSIDNVKIPDDAAETVLHVLTRVLPIEEQGPKFDQFLGTKEKQLVGAKWPVPKTFIEAMNDGSRDLQRSEFRGEVTLKGRSEVQSTPCLDIAADIVVEGVVPKELPETAKVRKSTYRLALERSYPLDARKQVLREKAVSSYELDIAVLGRTGEVGTALYQDRTFEVQRQPL